MSQELAIQSTQDIQSVWKTPQEIRKLFAPNLADSEFQYFMGLSLSLGANPFLREIWAVKYDDKKAASIFLGRDFYRRKAQEQPSYDGHLVDAVYEKDTFAVRNGLPDHTYQAGNRGKLIGAYCLVTIKGRKMPYYVFADLNEYKVNSPTWNKSPATMIKKVAEAQALRGAFQGVFAGTYDESEAWEPASTEIALPDDTIDVLADVLDPANGNGVATQEQRDLMGKIIQSHVFSSEEKAACQKAIDTDTLPKGKASEWIDWLQEEVKARKEIEAQEREEAV